MRDHLRPPCRRRRPPRLKPSSSISLSPKRALPINSQRSFHWANIPLIPCVLQTCLVRHNKAVLDLRGGLESEVRRIQRHVGLDLTSGQIADIAQGRPRASSHPHLRQISHPSLDHKIETASQMLIIEQCRFGNMQAHGAARSRCIKATGKSLGQGSWPGVLGKRLGQGFWARVLGKGFGQGSCVEQ
jgi:hypothetical protein